MLDETKQHVTSFFFYFFIFQKDDSVFVVAGQHLNLVMPEAMPELVVFHFLS